jgi:hypothetical protein
MSLLSSILIVLLCAITISNTIAAIKKINTNRKRRDSRESSHHYQSTTTKVTGAITILVGARENNFAPRDDRKCGLGMNLDSLQTYFIPKNPYPIILLTDIKWTQSEILQIRKKWSLLDIFFVNVKHIFDVHNETVQFEDYKDPLSNLGYKRMCQFWMTGYLQDSIVEDYQYIMRLDEDSCFLSSINFNIFEEMKYKHIHYTYHSSSGDPEAVVKDLLPYTYDYIQRNSINISNPIIFHKYLSSQLKEKDGIPFINSNLEVIDTHRFRSPDIMSYVQNITDENLIFHRRWGDAPLRFVIAVVFLGKTNVMRWCSFRYQHSAWEPFEECPAREHKNVIEKNF